MPEDKGGAFAYKTCQNKQINLFPTESFWVCPHIYKSSGASPWKSRFLLRVLYAIVFVRQVSMKTDKNEAVKKNLL